MNPHIKAILFDADGVMIAYSKKFSQHLAEEMKLPKEDIDAFFTKDFQECLIGKADLKVKLKPWLSKWGWQNTAEELIHRWFELEDVPNQELIAMIPKLQHRSIFCYMTTNQEKYRASYLYEHKGFGKLFDHFFSSHEIKAKKPDQLYWRYVWDSLQYLEGFDNRSQILVIDDTMRNITSAQEFGFQSHLFVSNDECISLLNSL